MQSSRRPRIAGLILAIATLSLGTWNPVSAAEPTDPAPESAARILDREREDLAEFRTAFGLDAAPAKISELLQVGVQFTPEERIALDIHGREVFQAQVDEELAPFVTSLPTFAGAWYDQQDGGRLVVMMTDATRDVTAEIERLAPPDGKGVRVVVATHTSARDA